MCGRSGWEEKVCNQYPKRICKGFVRNQGLKTNKQTNNVGLPFKNRAFPFSQMTYLLLSGHYLFKMQAGFLWFFNLPLTKMLSPGPGAFSTVSENSSHRSLATSTMAKRLHPPHPVRCLGENTHQT